MAKVTLAEGTASRVDGYVDFVKTFVLTNYQIDIASVPYDIVDEIRAPLGLQPGLYLDGKIGSRVVGRSALPSYPSDKRVLIAEISVESGTKQYWGVIFHEFGHAAFDVLRKNGEPAAWTVEVTALASYKTANPGLASAIKEFVVARRGAGCYGQWASGHEEAARKAYEAITGESL